MLGGACSAYKRTKGASDRSNIRLHMRRPASPLNRNNAGLPGMLKEPPVLPLHRPTLILTTALCLLPLAAAHAQEFPGDGPGNDGARAGLDLGGGVGLRPRYEGSDEHVVRALPLVRAYANSPAGRIGLGAGGLTWSVRPADGLNLGLSLGYQRGRKESASQELRGLGDVKGGTEVGASGSYRLGAASIRLGAKTLTSGAGKTSTTAELGLSYFMRLGERFVLIPTADLVWANDKYMQRYFGVSAEQSLNAGLPVYSAGSGLKSAGVGLMLRYRLTDSVGLFALARENVLLGDAGDSPITRNRSQPQLLLGASYRFELR